MRRRTFTTGAASLFAGLAAGAASAQTTGLTTIRLTSAPSDDLRPLLYAQNAGLFRKAGLAVDIDRTSSGAIAAQAILAGAMDIGKSSLTPLIAAHIRGIPFVLIAPSAIHQAANPNSAVIVASDASYRSPADLQGKTIACTAIGDIGYLGFRALVDQHGGDSSTLRWVEVPTSAVATAVAQGRIAAGIITEPYMTKELSTGKVRMLVDVLAGYPTPVLESAFYGTRDYVAKNRDVVARFAKVVEQGAAYSNAHESQTVALFAAFSGMEPDVLSKMHLTVSATKFSPQQIQPVIDLAAKYGVIPKRFDAREMIAKL